MVAISPIRLDSFRTGRRCRWHFMAARQKDYSSVGGRRRRLRSMSAAVVMAIAAPTATAIPIAAPEEPDEGPHVTFQADLTGGGVSSAGPSPVSRVARSPHCPPP